MHPTCLKFARGSRLFSPFAGQKGQQSPPQMVASCNFIHVGCRLLCCPFLLCTMGNKFSSKSHTTRKLVGIAINATTFPIAVLLAFIFPVLFVGGIYQVYKEPPPTWEGWLAALMVIFIAGVITFGEVLPAAKDLLERFTCFMSRHK